MVEVKLEAAKRGKCVRYGRGKGGRKVCRQFAKKPLSEVRNESTI